jgi:hypothetical protein
VPRLRRVEPLVKEDALFLLREVLILVPIAGLFLQLPLLPIPTERRNFAELPDGRRLFDLNPNLAFAGLVSLLTPREAPLRVLLLCCMNCGWPRLVKSLLTVEFQGFCVCRLTAGLRGLPVERPAPMKETADPRVYASGTILSVVAFHCISSALLLARAQPVKSSLLSASAQLADRGRISKMESVTTANALE